MNINYGNDRKSKTVNKTVSFNDEFMNSLENNSNSESNLGKKNSMKRSIDVKSQNLEIQKLKLLNKKLTNELKKCKSIILKRDNNALEVSINNSSRKLEKDKMIQSLQKEKIQNDKNYIKLINNCNNYKSKLNKLMDENKKLKQINLLIKKTQTVKLIICLQIKIF